MAEKEYIRLARPRRKSGFLTSAATRSSLWLGKDHLLCVETNGYTETYKRFYFRDIQAFTMQRTIWQMVASILLLLPILLFGGITIAAGLESSRQAASRGDWIAIGAMGGTTLLFAAFLGVNLMSGPACLCRIRTAVQEEEIPALKRVKQVNKVMVRIRPLIAGAQGVLTREEIPARMRELAAHNQPRLVVDNPDLPPRMMS